MQLPYLLRSAITEWPIYLLVRALFIAAATFYALQLSAAQPEKSSEFDPIARVVDSYFAEQRDYQPGDLIRRGQVEAVLNNVAATGWKKFKPADILDACLPDNAFIVRELASPAGKRFMRKIARHPGAYSHLDRLSSIPHGRATIRDLVHTPGGDEMITYMTTTKAGSNLGSMMSGVRGGTNLNKPTGRIYTVDDLLAALRKLHDASRAK
jgi:hypothetical protein